MTMQAITFRKLERYLAYLRVEIETNDGDFDGSMVTLHDSDAGGDISMETIFSVLSKP